MADGGSDKRQFLRLLMLFKKYFKKNILSFQSVISYKIKEINSVKQNQISRKCELVIQKDKVCT